MFTVYRTAGILQTIFPVSARFIAKTPGANGAPFRKNALIIRACSGSVLQRIQKKQVEAIVGGGQKRIDTQHRKVSWPLAFLIIQVFLRNSCKVQAGDLKNNHVLN